MMNRIKSKLSLAAGLTCAAWLAWLMLAWSVPAVAQYTPPPGCGTPCKVTILKIKTGTTLTIQDASGNSIGVVTDLGTTGKATFNGLQVGAGAEQINNSANTATFSLPTAGPVVVTSVNTHGTRFDDSSGNPLASVVDLGTVGRVDANGLQLGAAAGTLNGTGTVIFTSAGTEYARGTTTAFTIPNGIATNLGTGGFSVGGGTAIPAILSGSASLNAGGLVGGPGCTSAGAGNITVTGADVGDPVFLGFDQTSLDVAYTFRGQVTASGNVRVDTCCWVATCADPGAITVTATVFDY